MSACLMALSLCSVVSAAQAPSEICVPDFKTYIFEKEVPTEFSEGTNSKLSVSDKGRREDAKGSLRWDWDRPGATITFKDPEAFKHLTGENPDPIVYKWVTGTTLSGMSLWVFNETPLPEPLYFEIGDGKTVDCRFWMNLNFKGWRELKFLYGRDLIGFPNQKTAD
ncbi:MAG: chondroitinase family protein, partial [Victivallales bacterium]